jgi:chemotaxis signal transduction protein
MVETNEIATLVILTFRVGPFLLGVEADQIAQLPRTAQQEPPTHGTGVVDELPTLDLRPACGLPPAANEEQWQLLLVKMAGEMVGYKVDQVGDLITVDIARHIWPLPPILDDQKQWQQLWGVCQWADDLVLLVDLQYEPQNTPKEG